MLLLSFAFLGMRQAHQTFFLLGGFVVGHGTSQGSLHSDPSAGG
jgi:hypothetical protein